MPVVPLFDTARLPGTASRQMRSPGGYEYWWWEAFDEEQQTHLKIAFWQGYSFDADYRQAYLRYLRKPTKFAPPLPSEKSCLTVTLVEKDAVIMDHSHRLESALCNPGRADVIAELGENQAIVNKGGVEIKLRLESIRGDILFSAAPVAVQSIDREPASANHYRGQLQPPCPVGGTIVLWGNRQIDFSGHGFSDHGFGTEPLGTDCRAFLRGSILSEAPYPTFELRIKALFSTSANGTLMQSDGASHTIHANLLFRKGIFNANAYPDSMEVTPNLHLCNPRRVHQNQEIMTLIYTAFLNGNPVRALIELARTD